MGIMENLYSFDLQELWINQENGKKGSIMTNKNYKINMNKKPRQI